MIVVEPEAPQAIHAACVSLPNPCDVKQPGRSPETRQRNRVPRVGSGGLYGPPFSSSTPFFALSAEPRSELRNLQFLAQSRASKSASRAPSQPGERLRRGAAYMGPPDLRQHPFLRLLQQLARSQNTAEFRSTNRRPRTLKFPSLWQVVSKKRRLLWATLSPVNNPFALPCSFWAEAPKPQF